MIRNINGFMLLFLVSFFISCKKNEAKEPETLKTIKSAETKEFFSLVKPINKPEEPLYKTIYNDYSISINSNASNQELIFKKGNVEISKVLKFYYETPEIVFHLYKSSFDNFVIIIEGRDYYSSILGVYYLDNKLTNIVDIDETLSYKQDEPEKKGFKFPKVEILKNINSLKCKIYLGDKFLYDKNYEISTKLETKKNNASENNIASNNINQYLNNKDYFIKTFDINKDGIKDKIVSNNPYQGDELLIFLGEDGINFRLVLKTINFSADGGNQISDIIETEEGFNITTLFPDRGSYEENYHIVFKNNTFILKTLETFSTLWQDGYKETCTITDIDFNLNKSMHELLSILSKRDKNCVKAKL
jgi:hypothetical protein